MAHLCINIIILLIGILLLALMSIYIRRNSVSGEQIIIRKPLDDKQEPPVDASKER